MFQSRLTDPNFVEALETPVYKEYFSYTLASQNAVKLFVGSEFRQSITSILNTGNVLLTEEHSKFILKSLFRLPAQFESMDSSRTWLLYWSLQALSLLNERITDDVSEAVIKFLSYCQDENGGFAGGPGQDAHLAPTYAAIHTIALLQQPSGYKIINRPKLREWLIKLKRFDGAYALHIGGEVDLRAVYCAVSSCSLLNMIDDDLFGNSTDWILSCQTYEGGFGASPNNEAHGGYSYCGAASLAILNKLHLCNTKRFLRWTVFRQMCFEGGFQGRTNKLVDSCYSFWVGALFSIFKKYFNSDDKEDGWTFDIVALQDYILFASQCTTGGFRDKPDRSPDAYHTCYALSGLSVLQHCNRKSISNKNIEPSSVDELLVETHPYHNITMESYESIRKYFL